MVTQQKAIHSQATDYLGSSQKQQNREVVANAARKHK